VTSSFAGEATIAAARAVGRLVRRVRRSQAARDLRRVAPYLGAVAVALALFPAVRFLCYLTATLGVLPTALLFWLPASFAAGIFVGLFIRQGAGPRT